MTQKGRVVYERIQHGFNDKAVARILKGTIRFLTSTEMAEKLAGFIRETLRSDVVPSGWSEGVARILVEIIAEDFGGLPTLLEDLFGALLDLPGLAQIPLPPGETITTVLTKYEEKQEAKKKGGK